MQPTWQTTDGRIRLYLGDCLDVLPTFGPQSFDALITDPPYGIGEAANNNKSRSCLAESRDYGKLDWDNEPAPPELIDHCRRVSRWQVIFGGNYFTLPPARCWLVWDKMNGENDFADCELAWTNLNKAVRQIHFRWHGMLRDEECERIHPTQKPIRVMQWAMAHCHDSATIIDPFAGSFTSVVAAMRTGRKIVAIEREPCYFDSGVRRIEAELNRMPLFEPPVAVQKTLIEHY